MTYIGTGFFLPLDKGLLGQGMPNPGPGWRYHRDRGRGRLTACLRLVLLFSWLRVGRPGSGAVSGAGSFGRTTRQLLPDGRCGVADTDADADAHRAGEARWALTVREAVYVP
ncbi:MAG TPA: hypothetical protein DEQ61_11775, partial [Streptomyces sp.]|nr:hypothetical protein [Streptomyces sp.]